MEKNTVVLSLDQYNTMRDKVEVIDKNRTFYVKATSCSGISTIIVVSEDEAVEKIAKANESLQKEVNDYFSRIITAENNQEIVANELAEKLKKMSIWEFRRWRKSRSRR